MLREELLTDIGRYAYDYSPIPKQVIPEDVLHDIASSYCIREGVISCEWVYTTEYTLMHGILKDDPTMHNYESWNRSFAIHGYSAPLIDLQKEETVC